MSLSIMTGMGRFLATMRIPWRLVGTPGSGLSAAGRPTSVPTSLSYIAPQQSFSRTPMNRSDLEPFVPSRTTAWAGVALLGAALTAAWVEHRSRRAEREQPPAGRLLDVD